MAGTDTQEVVRRLARLERLVYAYGHLLTAAELERALPGLVPVIAGDEITEAEAGALLKEVLQRGPARLLADLEEMERVARALKDEHIYGGLNRVREAFLNVVRYNVPALLRRLEQSGDSGGGITPLQKEVQAFAQNVARTVTAPPDDFSEIFADEEPTGESFPPPRSPDSDAAAAGTASTPLSGSAVDEAEIGWTRDRIEVINEMLQRWAIGERLAPDASALVRRGRLSLEQCRALYQELLEAGAAVVLDRLARWPTLDEQQMEVARVLRGRITDGVVGSVPRLLGLLASGGRLDTEVDGVRADPDRVLADLADYLARSAELYDAGSPLRERLLYLAGELRAVTNL